MLNSSFFALIPSGATHALTEERMTRNGSVWAVVSIVPGGSSIILNSYSEKEVAVGATREVNEYLAARVDTERFLAGRGGRS